MVVETTKLCSLPNEILIQVLSSFRTRPLLRFASVSHRFHDLVLRILQYRLKRAAALKDHKLILECFHPSSKLSSPHAFCEYLGTDGLSDQFEGQGALYDDGSSSSRLGELNNIYSHFRPLLPEEYKTTRRRHPAGDVPGHPNSSTWFPGPSEEASDEKDEYVSEDIHLDSHELFSQLCAITNIVKVGPKRGLFLSCVNVGDGVIRIWRDWLAEAARMSFEALTPPQSPSWDGNTRQKSDPSMLWVDNGKDIGLRFRVSQKAANRPVIMSKDEDPPVSYNVQYTELVIRSVQLLLMVEEALQQESNHTGKAIVIGSWN